MKNSAEESRPSHFADETHVSVLKLSSAFCDDRIVYSWLSFNRDWRYHKEERVWITRAPGMEPAMKTNTYERGTYYFFDCLNWRKVAKEFHLEYDKLDERPHVPSTFNYNPAQQAF